MRRFVFAALLVAGALIPGVAGAQQLWVAPVMGGSDILDGQRYDVVMGAYAGVRAGSGYLQIGSEGLGLLADEVRDPIARAFDLRAGRSFGPASAGVHFDFVLLGNRDRRGEIGPEFSVQYRALGGEHDLGVVYGVGRGETFAETTQYVQLSYFGFWEVEDGRGIFLKLHASYHVWRWEILGAPMLEPAIGLRF